MKSNFHTISIEEALTPFITEVEALIDLRKMNSFRPLSQYSLCKACEAVNIAVMGFISTAENIALNYPQISTEITNSCNWSRSLITKILDSTLDFNVENDTKFSSLNKMNLTSSSKTSPFLSLDSRGTKTHHSKATFIQFSEGLMRSIERILLLADWIIVLDIRGNVIKVTQSLKDMDSKGTENFPAFMHLFSRFGAYMVELGEISGQRQLDLKSNQHRCLVAFTRSMLERTTMMILAVWKVNFRHDSHTSRTLRALLLQYTNYLLELMMGLLVVSHPLYSELSHPLVNDFRINCDEFGFLEKQSQVLCDQIFFKGQLYIWEIINNLKQFISIISQTNNEDAQCSSESESKIDMALSLINELINSSQVFTQCFFVCLSERQQIISLCRRLRVQLRTCFENSEKESNENDDRECQARLFADDLCDQILTMLFNITVNYSDDVLKSALNISHNIDAQQSEIVKSSENGKPPKSGVIINFATEKVKQVDKDLHKVDMTKHDTGSSFKLNASDLGIIKHKVITVCKFIANVSMNKEISLVCNLLEEVVENLYNMINLTIQIFSEVSISKHARDCADVLLDVWISIITDIINIKNDTCDWRKNKYSNQNYQFNASSNSSSNIMKKYKLFHSANRTHSVAEINAPFSAPSSPSITLIPKPNGQCRFNFDRNSMSRINFINPFGSTVSVNFNTEFMHGREQESPNPWLSVNEIERIISMKGQIVIDLAAQITMFSHNEGHLKTSIELMNTTQQLVRELANFHAFAERNLLSDHILSELDKFPSLISTICTIQNHNTTNRLTLMAKIDKIVELVRCSATLVSTIIANWRSQPWRNVRQINSTETPKNQYYSTSQISSIPYAKNFLNFEELSDKTSFSDTTNNFLLQKSRVPLTRSHSMGRKLDYDPFSKSM